jgi:hypothetical protein
MAAVDVLEADIERAERSAKYDAELRSAGRPPRSQPGFIALRILTSRQRANIGHWKSTSVLVMFLRSTVRSFAPLALSRGI